jgi:GT2 family glycosyltransferase
MINKKVGIGIITCNRPEYLKQLLDSINYCNWADLVIINDGDKFELEGYNYYIQHNEKNLGVGKSKNKAMQHLLDKDCDYIFIIEDDMIILDDSVFDKYIQASEVSGIQHLMFAYHGPANKGGVSGGIPRPRKIIDYGDIQISLNEHCVGSFCFYTRECLEIVGLMDEEFDKNNFEHVEHSYRLAKNNYSTPYWWWADLANSIDYIQEQACSEVSSSIRRGSDWLEKIKWSAKLFERKHGYMPAWSNAVPDTSIQTIIKTLKTLKPSINDKN